jgi:hypothetical protein
MLVERIDRGHRQHRPDTERHRRRIPHFDAGGVDRVRQFLTAPRGGRGEPVPAGLRPGTIGFFPAGRGGDDAVLERRAVAVARCVERGDHLRCKAAGFLKHSVDHVVGEVAVEAVRHGLAEAGTMPEREGDVGNRRGVAHGV